MKADTTPKTIGELRQKLARLGNPWTVNPQLGDDDPVPNKPRGGQNKEDIPEESRLTPLQPGVNLKKVISKHLPANQFLRQRWMEEGMLTKEDVDNLSPGVAKQGAQEWGVA